MRYLKSFVIVQIFVFLFFSVAGAQNPKKSGQVKQYTIEQFLTTTNITGSSFSPDDSKILFTSNKSGIYNLYSIPVAGGEAKQLTNFKDTTYAISYFPKDDRVLFSQDKGGNENNHIFVLNTDGQVKDLTPAENARFDFQGWAHDGASFFYRSNERDPKFFDLYRMDAKTYEKKMIYENKEGLDVGAISGDGQLISLVRTNTTNDSDLFLYDVSKKETKHLTPHQGDINYVLQDFDVDNKSLYYLSDEGGEFTHLDQYDIATGKMQKVQSAPWDIMYSYFSHNGKFRVVATNEDARTHIQVIDQASGKELKLPEFPKGDITSVKISDSENLMSLYFNGDRSPSNLYVFDFGNQKLTKLTDTQNPEINPDDLVEAEVIRYKSFDGLEIPSILFKPHQADDQNKAPALVWVHGGPGGQTRKGYSNVIQYLVNHGYVILGVNNRGSSGYGKTFFAADDAKHGHEPLWDCVEAKKYLASLPYVDAKRIGIMGGSYGGYMVLAALTLKPEEFVVGVDLFGISNLIRTLEQIPPYWESFRKALYKEMGDPVKDKDKLLATSPLFHADNIVKPLMVLQGKNDPRVLKQESDDIVNAVRKRNGVVEYIVFDDEGHGFSKKENQLRGYRAILDFLDKYLKNSKAA
jgi:dipeptidyl aminopeptidase/acylaminoacyl peptidase